MSYLAEQLINRYLMICVDLHEINVLLFLWQNMAHNNYDLLLQFKKLGSVYVDIKVLMA